MLCSKPENKISWDKFLQIPANFEMIRLEYTYNQSKYNSDFFFKFQGYAIVRMSDV
jgi:hypothetical protein